MTVPKNKIREAQVIFSIKQIMTWILGLTVAEFRLIQYPVREFPYASKTSFTFEYFIYPAVCVIFNLHYPKTKRIIPQFRYYVYYCSTITFIEVIIEKYTDIIEYIHWHWYISWIALFITFFISHKYYVWFFKLDKKNEEAK